MSYVAVEGVIGVGKTTMARLVSERMGMPVLFERFEENPFLGPFYVDRARYAFQTEVFFLLNRYRQQQAEVMPAVEAGDLATDYMFAKTHIFARMNLAGDEWTLAENRTAWNRIQLLPRMLRGVAERSLATTVLGTPVSMPVLVPPMGFHGLCHTEAEEATARATGQEGTIFCSSTVSGATASSAWIDVTVVWCSQRASAAFSRSGRPEKCQ